MGEHPSGLLWTAAALVDRPHVIVEAHRRFVEAGADVVITSSYQASVPGFVDAGLSADEARRVLASTTSVARASGASLVAASVGPFGACLGDRSEYHGRYTASWDTVRTFHRARLEVLVDTGPDVFAIETIPTAIEAEIVVEELRRLTAAPAWVTFTCLDDVHTCGLDLLADAVDRVEAAVQAVGVNCTSPSHVAPLLGSMRSRLPRVVYPNHVGEVDLVSLTPSWLEAGARIVGGCCGVGTEGIRSLATLRASLA
jgi:homocysteine S-methyltransferase